MLKMLKASSTAEKKKVITSFFCLAGHGELASEEITGVLYRPRLL